MIALPDNILSDEGLPRVLSWIERKLGGKVVSTSRQSRWRPMYFVDVETTAGIRELGVRGIAGFDGASDDQRQTVMRDYMKMLADLHRLPVEPFKAAGAHHAAAGD